MSSGLPRVVITGVGLTSPNGNDLAGYRRNLLAGVSGVKPFTTRHLGAVLAGVCDFDELRYQKRKVLRRGTRAGSIAIWCANQALEDSKIALGADRSRVGVLVGITEHGNVETENEIASLREYGDDTRYWSHHHNPRTVANNPAGEVTLNLSITGPHYTLGAACAAGNVGLIQGVQLLQLGIIDLALAGGVSESIHTFGIFASFKAQNALATHEDPAKASRPFDKARNGIVVSEGGCLYTLERLDDARRRGAKIYGEVVGYNINSDATDFVLPSPEGQKACMRGAIERARMTPNDIDLVSTHATATPSGDPEEIAAIRAVFEGATPYVNNTKSFIGHTMGAAGALELAGNLPSFEDGLVHPTINVDALDEACALPNLVLGRPVEAKKRISTILNNSFGMLGINSTVVIRRAPE